MGAWHQDTGRLTFGRNLTSISTSTLRSQIREHTPIRRQSNKVGAAEWVARRQTFDVPQMSSFHNLVQQGVRQTIRYTDWDIAAQEDICNFLHYLYNVDNYSRQDKGCSCPARKLESVVPISFWHGCRSVLCFLMQTKVLRWKDSHV
jgi:hypothetical protein